MDCLTPVAVENRLRAALATITSLWDDMLEIPGTSSNRRPSEAELTRPEAVAALRREIHHELTVWARLVHRHFPTTDEQPATAPDVCDYLTRHSDKLATAGERALEGIEDSAEALTRFVYGTKKPAVALGPCPHLGCHDGTIRTTNDHDEEGRSLQRCDTCGEKHTTDEWLTLMNITRKPTLTADEVLDLAHKQFGIRLTAHALTCLTSKGTLTPISQTKPYTYDLTDAVRYLTARAAKTAA